MIEKEGRKPNIVGVHNAPTTLLSSAKSATRNRSDYQLANNKKMSTKDNFGNIVIFYFYNLSAVLKH